MDKIEGRRIGGINRDVFVFTFFLLISFTLWCLNSLGKESEADVRLPLKIINTPKGKTISGEIPDRLYFTLRGTGFSIIKLKFPREKTPVVIDLSKVTYKRVPDSKDPDYYIVTSGLSKSLKLQLHSGFDVVSIKPDTVFFTLSKIEQKSNR